MVVMNAQVVLKREEVKRRLGAVSRMLRDHCDANDMKLFGCDPYDHAPNDKTIASRLMANFVEALADSL